MRRLRFMLGMAGSVAVFSPQAMAGVGEIIDTTNAGSAIEKYMEALGETEPRGAAMLDNNLPHPSLNDYAALAYGETTAPEIFKAASDYRKANGELFAGDITPKEMATVQKRGEAEPDMAAAMSVKLLDGGAQVRMAENSDNILKVASELQANPIAAKTKEIESSVREPGVDLELQLNPLLAKKKADGLKRATCAQHESVHGAQGADTLGTNIWDKSIVDTDYTNFAAKHSFEDANELKGTKWELGYGFLQYALNSVEMEPRVACAKKVAYVASGGKIDGSTPESAVRALKLLGMDLDTDVVGKLFAKRGLPTPTEALHQKPLPEKLLRKIDKNFVDIADLRDSSSGTPEKGRRDWRLDIQLPGATKKELEHNTIRIPSPKENLPNIYERVLERMIFMMPGVVQNTPAMERGPWDVAPRALGGEGLELG